MKKKTNFEILTEIPVLRSTEYVLTIVLIVSEVTNLNIDLLRILLLIQSKCRNYNSKL